MVYYFCHCMSLRVCPNGFVLLWIASCPFFGGVGEGGGRGAGRTVLLALYFCVL